MSITEADIKLLASQRLTDTTDGGGRMTGAVVQSGVDNNIFDDVSNLDRVYGRVSLRKVFCAVLTNDTDKYLGARIILDQAPQDDNVHGLLFGAGSTNDTRAQTTSRVQAYLAPGPAYQGLLFGDHLAGQSVVVLIERPESTPPEVGSVLMLRVNAGLPTEADQYIRVTNVASVIRTFTDAAGDFKRAVVTLSISDPLISVLPGFDASRTDSSVSYTGKTRVFETVVADASQYYGIRPLASAVSLGAYTIKADTVFSPLLPSAQIESPIADAKSNGVTTALVSAGAALTQTVTVTWTTTQNLFVGGGILPGSLSVVRSGVTLTDSGGVLKNGATEVGAVDYSNGILTLSTNVWGPNWGTYSVTYTPAGSAAFVTQSIGLPVTISSRSLSYVVTLLPLPARQSLGVSYLAGGRWYTLYENGSGGITGTDSSLGAGSLNYSTGTVTVTLGALPDVGSSIILQWAEQVLTDPVPPIALALGGKAYFAFNSSGAASEEPGAKALTPSGVTVVWNDGSARSASDNGLGLLTGAASGTVDYVHGVVRICPNVLPPVGTVFSISSPTGVTTRTSAASINLNGGALGPNVIPHTVSLVVDATIVHDAHEAFTLSGTPYATSLHVVDNGLGALVWSDFDGALYTVGTINYTTGVISLATDPITLSTSWGDGVTGSFDLDLAAAPVLPGGGGGSYAPAAGGGLHLR